MITVLLASTLFRTRNNTGLVQDELKSKNLTVTQDQARGVAHAFNDRLWELHTWIGYFNAVFLLGRFLLEMVQPTDEKLAYKLRRVTGFTVATAQEKQLKQHYLLVKWGYVVFYLLMLVMAVTGVGLAFEDVPFLRHVRGSLRSLHSYTQYGIYAFVLVHIAGVILADTGRYPGLVSSMIHGKRRVQQ